MHLNLIVLSSVVKGYGRRWLWSEQHYTMYWQALGDLVGGRGVIKISMTGELLYKLLYVLVGIPSKGGGFICVTPPPRWFAFAYRIFQFSAHLSIVMLVISCVTEGVKYCKKVCVVLFVCHCRCLSIRNSRKWALTKVLWLYRWWIGKLSLWSRDRQCDEKKLATMNVVKIEEGRRKQKQINN